MSSLNALSSDHLKEVSGRKTRIAFVQHSLPFAGGAEQVVYNVINGLDRGEFEPILCCLHELGDWGEKLRDSGCTTYGNISTSKYSPLTIRRLTKIFHSEQVDILYVTASFHNAIVGPIAAKFSGVPRTVMAYHNFDIVLRAHQDRSIYRDKIQRLADRFLTPRFDRIIALAENHKESIANTKNLPLEKISDINNGIDSSRFHNPIGREEARRQFGLPVEGPAVGILASLIECKGHRIFLDCARQILHAVPDCVFVIAGDGPLRETLNDQARDLGIADRVHFLGMISNVPDWFASLDVSVMTSFSEAFPLAILESMAASLPVVATNVGSIGEIVDDGDTGFLVERADQDHFVDCVTRLLASAELRHKMGSAARNKVESKYTIPIMVRATEQTFRDVLK